MSDLPAERPAQDAEVVITPAATFTAFDVLRLYRMEHASRLHPHQCVPGHLCAACARAETLFASAAKHNCPVCGSLVWYQLGLNNQHRRVCPHGHEGTWQYD